MFLGLIVGATADAATSYADVIFSNLGAGNSYYCCGGSTVSGPSSFSNSYAAQGEGFTSPGHYNITQINIALTNASGTNGAYISLWTNVGGLPGAILGNWTVTNLPQFGTTSNTLATISDITGITLTVGGSYYRIAEPIASDTLDVWNDNVTGAGGPHVQDTGAGFVNTCCAPNGAYEVLGVIPEPSTFAILIVGLASFGLISRRKTLPRVASAKVA